MIGGGRPPTHRDPDLLAGGAGRIHFCRALQLPEGGDGKAVKTQNKKQLLSQLLFVLVEATQLKSAT